MKNYQTLKVTQTGSVLNVSLNRPELKNAFNDTLILELLDLFSTPATELGARVILLTGEGDLFSAGGDINWMKKSAAYTPEQNKKDAYSLAKMLEAINTYPTPVVAQVHGACFGGGLGLASVCDIVVASEETIFSFSEVKLGLIPAVIGPFVIEKIGASAMRSLFLTGERFDTKRALSLGLIHKVVTKETLTQTTTTVIKELLTAGPEAQATAKKFIRDIQNLDWEQKLDLATTTLANLRASKEGQEGLGAFLEKRKPAWINS